MSERIGCGRRPCDVANVTGMAPSGGCHCLADMAPQQRIELRKAFAHYKRIEAAARALIEALERLEANDTGASREHWIDATERYERCRAKLRRVLEEK